MCGRKSNVKREFHSVQLCLIRKRIRNGCSIDKIGSHVKLSARPADPRVCLRVMKYRESLDKHLQLHMDYKNDPRCSQNACNVWSLQLDLPLASVTNRVSCTGCCMTRGHNSGGGSKRRKNSLYKHDATDVTLSVSYNRFHDTPVVLTCPHRDCWKSVELGSYEIFCIF